MCLEQFSMNYVCNLIAGGVCPEPASGLPRLTILQRPLPGHARCPQRPPCQRLSHAMESCHSPTRTSVRARCRQQRAPRCLNAFWQRRACSTVTESTSSSCTSVKTAGALTGASDASGRASSKDVRPLPWGRIGHVRVLVLDE